ncbi:enoyl-CoA hydratase/isomerase family protein [Caldifermentibacillus hisashii]|jgi:2-(1,2-epoxy-1,2-dihydrophenyl)acetyl-CoA isomerase|uniref:enoyl-CoA hydratase/isomerase family protein n=1 Tax=Caldifermentibacillus hisashii TaxID=996558 RepID=UPI0031FE2659
MGERVLLEKQGSIAQIYFNEPDKLNALSSKLKEELLPILNEIEFDPNIKVVILAGRGKAFCAGGDLKGMASMEYNAAVIKRNMDLSSTIIERIRKMPKIVIAAVHGYCAGAGLSLALSSDMIVAESGTKLILSFKNVGLAPDLGIHYHLPRIVGEQKAKEWIWQGMKITVEDAVKEGFTITVAPKDNLMKEAMKLAKTFAEGPFQAFIYSKQLINHSTHLTVADVLAKENDIHTILRTTFDHKEGVNAFFEKRSANFKGE